MTQHLNRSEPQFNATSTTSTLPQTLQFDFQQIKKLVAERYINEQKHPQYDLLIYNYTPKAQYDRFWTEETLACRGLITDANHAVVARPFKKFFNLEEHLLQNGQLPVEPFEVYEKLDGSLGIIYFADGKPQIATRGSFTSDQAKRATAMLYAKYPEVINNLKPELTYLLEIIYPENRIVVDYKSREELILIAVIDTATGAEISLSDERASVGLPLVTRYDGINDIEALKKLEEENKEGFVVKFQSGLRVKVKFEEYKRLHRIVTQVSSKTVWEHLRDGLPFDEILERVPDEFYHWVKSTIADLQRGYTEIETLCKKEFEKKNELDKKNEFDKNEFKNSSDATSDRKAIALYFQTCTYPSILFAMLDGKDYAPHIWKLLRPKFEKPFREDES